MSPERGWISSDELLSGAADELLELSDEEGDDIRGTPAVISGSFELLLILVADESASSEELLMGSWLEEMLM
jgi:hypothetical protein